MKKSSSRSSGLKNGAVITTFDAAAIEWCSPSFLGCKICASATADKGNVTLTLSLKTPFGNISKSFSFSTNISYTWKPFSKLKLTIDIANLTEDGGVVSFDLGLKPCVDVPIWGWKCYSFHHHFVIPIPVKAEELDQKFSDYLMVMSNSGGQAGSSPATSLLQGDIYNQHANTSGGFPTVPVVSCVTTCTGFSPICMANQGQAKSNVGFPTVPVVSCAVTCTGVSPICMTNQGQVQSNVGFPTVPVVSCAVTCTGVSPICMTNQGQAQSNVGFPTVPVVSCAVTCTGISPVCMASQGQAKPEGGFPTVPVVSCVTTCTGISPICMSNPEGPKPEGGFPTVPVVSCVTTCTGISPICMTK